MVDDLDTMFGDENDGSSAFKQLRDHAKSLERQLKQAQKDAAELKEFKEGIEKQSKEQELVQAFKQIGLKEKHVPLYLKATEGTVDVEAIKAFAEEYELPVQPAQEGGQQQQQTPSSKGFMPIAGSGVPVGKKRYTSTELEMLNKTDPAEAQAAIREGRVDTVGTIEELRLEIQQAQADKS